MELITPICPQKVIEVFRGLHDDARSLAAGCPRGVGRTGVGKQKRLRQTVCVSKVRVFYDSPGSFVGTIYEEPQVQVVASSSQCESL